jgi:hypothetical protein
MGAVPVHYKQSFVDQWFSEEPHPLTSMQLNEDQKQMLNKLTKFKKPSPIPKKFVFRTVFNLNLS